METGLMQLVTEGQNDEVLTTSKIVAENFGKRHADVLESIGNILSNSDKTYNNNKTEISVISSMFRKSSYKVKNSLRSYPIYYMNRDGFSLLAMGFDGKKALQFKLKFIEAFNKMEEYIKNQDKPSYQIEDQVLRAEKWIKEQKYTLSLYNTVKENKPKVSYYDKVLQSKSLVTATQIAKDYGMSARTLNTKLHDLGIQYKRGGQWFLYGKYQGLGYTQSKTYNNDKVTRLNTQWTQKGRLFLYDLLKDNNILPVVEQNN